MAFTAGGHHILSGSDLDVRLRGAKGSPERSADVTVAEDIGLKTRFLKLADELKGSYWFLPTIMALGAIVLAAAMTYLDTHNGSAWMDGLPWLYAARPDGARQVLSAISGSMITVAGTVFSVTIAAVVYASGQYGPRLLSNFMSNRGNQVTLGTFIATFVYCLLVLRTIRSAAEAGAGGEFVPNLALLVGVGLALCSIAVLIFFIHHVPSQLHINAVIEDVGDRLLAQIDQQFPRGLGSPAAVSPAPLRSSPSAPSIFSRSASQQEAEDRALVSSPGTGYLQVIDRRALMTTATSHDLVLRLQYQPGDFLHTGRVIIEAYPRQRCDEAVATTLRNAFTIGSKRTALQDLRFLVDELVEIAARALSPGVNDPFTALTCLDWLGAAMSELARRDLPSPYRLDDHGDLRIIAHPATFATFMDRGFGALAQYCAGDMTASLRYLDALGEVGLGCDDAEGLAVLDRHARGLAELASNALSGVNRARVLARADLLRQAFADPDFKRRLRDDSVERLNAT